MIVSVPLPIAVEADPSATITDEAADVVAAWLDELISAREQSDAATCAEDEPA